MANVSDENFSPNANVLAALGQLLDEKFPGLKSTYTIKRATKKGDNYMGVIYRVSVSLANASAESEIVELQFSLILKVPPHDLLQRKQFFARPGFLRESLAYEEFLPLLKEFQHSKGVANGFVEYAECYYSTTEDMKEALLMEDLCCKKFELNNRFDELTREHVVMVMCSYAKLHAVSFAIKDQQPEKLHKFAAMKDLFEQRKDDIQLGIYCERLKDNALASLDKNTAEVYRSTLQQYFARGAFFELLLPLIDGAACEPYAVVCHGDCWANNILYKHENSRVLDVRLLDWQVMRYASPITDLMYFIFTCTTKTFRQQHFQEMLNVYYEALTQHMKSLGSDATALFPRTIFYEEIKGKGAVGLLLAMLVLPIITMKCEDVPDLKELSEKIEVGDSENIGFISENNEDAYNKRMRDVVVDCIDNGYLE